jgi:hypothetical protein
MIILSKKLENATNIRLPEQSRTIVSQMLGIYFRPVEYNSRRIQ